MSGTFGTMGDVGFMGRMDGGREGITLQGQNVERPSSAALEDFWQAFIPDSLVDGNSQAMEDILARDATSAALTPTLQTAESPLGVSRDNCGVSSFGLSHPSLQQTASAAVDRGEDGQPRAVGDAGKQASAAVAGDRLRKLQEKNRRAQKRFREKQKARISSMEEQLEELNRKVAQLKTENVRLVSANNMLQQVASMNEQTGVAQGGREGITGSSAAEMVQGGSGGAYIDLQLGGDIVRVSSAFLKTAPADHVFKMWDRMLQEICNALAEVDQITGRAPPAEGCDPQALVPPAARAQTGSNTGSGSSSAPTPAIQAFASGREPPVTSEQQNARLQHLEKQLDDLTRGTCKVYWEAMKACPLRLRQLSLSSRYYPRFLGPEENLAFHMRIAQLMDLDLDQKWKTGALYLRYRRKMEACTTRRLELFKAAGRAPPDAVLEWRNYESWVSTQMNLNDIHDCLKEENDILLELQLDIFMQVWTPVQSSRYFSAGHPYIPDMPMVAHLHSVDVGLATPLSLPQLSTGSKHSDPESLLDGFEASDGNNTWPTPGNSSSGAKS